MTDLPPNGSDTPEVTTKAGADSAAQTPATKARKRKRSLLRSIAVFTGIGLGSLLGLGLVTLVAGRYYLTTEGGLARVTHMVDGMEIGRFGTLNIEGVKGDLLRDFTLAKLTVSDDKGVWLDARDIRLDWNYTSLLSRRFYADEVTARTINIIRQPELDAPEDKGGSQPIDFVVRKFAADVQLMEDFSKEYGHWRISGSASVPRRGNKDITADALSLTRPGDFLKGHVVLSNKPEDLRLNLNAQEARGGPLAGMLGYSPDAPFSAEGLIDGRNVRLVMTTGDYTPLRVSGQFSENNSFMSGYANFSGSGLLAPLAQRFGNTASIGLAAAPDRKREGYQGMAWKLVADNITSTASGYVRTGGGLLADNVKITVRTPSLARLAGVNVGDAASFEGRFKGDAANFNLDGAIDVTNARTSPDGYRLARLSGPLSLQGKDNSYTLSGQLAGTNGSTNDLIGKLLGRTPSVDFRAAYLKDGNLLLEHIDLKGSNLDLKGSGGRNLMGGLSFNADFNLKDITTLYPNGKGSFSGNIKGGMPRSGGNWTFDLDGRGRELLTGFSETDRLLGRTPRLTANASLNGGVVTINRAELAGASKLRLTGRELNRVTANGIIRGLNADLNLQWDAYGPFGVGPVVVDGNLKGGGKITGPLDGPMITLNSQLGAIAIGQLILRDATLDLTYDLKATNATNSFHLSGTHRGQPGAYAKGDFVIREGLIELGNLDINAGGLIAKGDVSITDQKLAYADLTIKAVPGAFIQRGSLDASILVPRNSDGTEAKVSVIGQNLIVRGTGLYFNNLSLIGTGNLSSLPLEAKFTTRGETPVSFDGQLTYSQLANGHRIVATRDGDLVASGIRGTLKNNSRFELVDGVITANANLGIGQKGNAHFTFGKESGMPGAEWVGRATLTEVDVTALNRDMTGTVGGNVWLAKNARGPFTGAAKLDFTSLASRLNPQTRINGALEANLDGDQLDVRACADYGNCVIQQRATKGGLLSANLTLPMINQNTPARLVTAPNGAVRGTIFINGEVEPLFNLVDGIDRKLSGILDTEINISGTVQNPEITGDVKLTKGRFLEGSTGLLLRDLDLAAAFNRNGLVLGGFNAKDENSGTICGNGRLRFGTSGALPASPQAASTCSVTTNSQGAQDTYLSLKLDDFAIIQTDIAKVSASGNITAEVNASSVLLKGALQTTNAEIKPELTGSNGIVRAAVTDRNAPPRNVPRRTSNGQTPLLSKPIRLDLQLLSDRIEVKGNGLDVLMNASANIRGTLTSPILSGSANVIRGDYDFAGKRFIFDDDGEVILSADPSRIRLNLSARREDPSITAIIRITGTAASPRIALTSEPELPQDEILARVLFGRSISQLSALEAAQLASGVASLAGGGGLDVFGGLRDLVRLDRLSISGEASNMTIAGGQRIRDNLYLEIIAGGEAGTEIRVEWLVKRNIAITSGFTGNNATNISVRWRRARD